PAILLVGLSLFVIDRYGAPGDPASFPRRRASDLPWVELKYSCTFRPSRKLALMGVSMIEPSGRAISPRMPASWRICACEPRAPEDRKSTRLNSSHVKISYAVFCLKKKNQQRRHTP